MDVMEKLVDIVCDATQINRCIHSCNHPPCAMVRGIVDALIENGVTVQEWIPVTERLPEKNDRWVLCLCVSGAIEVLKFDYTMWDWDAQYPGRCYMENYVTNWMPLPKPPKWVLDDAKAD